MTCTKQYKEAAKLADQFPQDDSAVIRFSGAAAHVKLGSNNNEAMKQAVACNEFCAYWLCYHETFETVFEHLDELEDLDGPQSSLEDGLLYAALHANDWVKTEGALDALKAALPAAPGWKDRLEKIREQKPSLEMYIGMFETAMDMLAEAGEI